MQLNASRIKVLQAQDDAVSFMEEVAAKELLNVSRDHYAYKRLLKDLIVQVCFKNSKWSLFSANLSRTHSSPPPPPPDLSPTALTWQRNKGSVVAGARQGHQRKDGWS